MRGGPAETQGFNPLPWPGDPPTVAQRVDGCFHL